MNEDKVTIVILLGTTREGRESEKAARYIYERCLKRSEITPFFVDPRDLNLPLDGNEEPYKDPKYTEITANADGFFIVTPEYNHGYPGSLKRMLDSEFKNYHHKAVAFAGVSNGRWGGVRVIESLLSPVRTVGLVATRTDVNFPNIQDIFDINGKPKDPIYEKIVDKALDELVWMSKALKSARKESMLK